MSMKSKTANQHNPTLKHVKCLWGYEPYLDYAPRRTPIKNRRNLNSHSKANIDSTASSEPKAGEVK